MKFLIILLLCILAASKVTLQSVFSKKENITPQNNLFFNAIMFSTISIIFFPTIIKNGITAATFMHGIIMGILSVLFQYFYIIAFNRGKMALTVIINNFSMLIPVCVSFFLFDENINVLKIIGLVLVLISFYLNVNQSENANKSNDIIWLICVMAVFTFNGLISVNQKIYSMYNKDFQIFEFIAVSYIVASILSWGMFFIISKDKKASCRPRLIFSGSMCGILLGIFQCLNTYAASVIPGTILYPLYNCGTSVMITLIGRLFLKEHLSARQKTGVVIGIIAIACMSL